MPHECEMTIAVVDDNDADRELISDMAGRILRSANIAHRIDCFADARSLLDALESGRSFHLLLLDVVMDNMDGFTLSAGLRKKDRNTFIVFISSSQELARLGYRVNASRYLLKPPEHGELAEALMYCYEALQSKKEILLPTARGHYRTSFPNIQFVEAYDRGTRFVLKDETVETKLKFSEAEAMLPKSMFLVCHRAYIVNLSLTKQISPYEFLMKSGAAVPISRHRYNEVNQQFVNFLTD